jgi:hypothetical protein
MFTWNQPLNLAQCYPTSRPGNLQLDLAPTYVSSPLLPLAKAEFDVWVTGSFSSHSVGDSSYMASITKYLQTAEQEKFCGLTVNNVSTFVNGEMVIWALNASNTLLIPFIIDPLGALGPIANWFLFGLQPDPEPDPLNFQSATSQHAYKNAMSPAVPTGLSHCADQYWPQNLPHIPFGHTYHSWYLTNWIRQTLSTNINLTFAQHLFQRIHKDYTPRTCQAQLNPYPNAVGHAALIRPAAYYEPDTIDNRDITSTMHPSPSFMTDP